MGKQHSAQRCFGIGRVAAAFGVDGSWLGQGDPVEDSGSGVTLKRSGKNRIR